MKDTFFKSTIILMVGGALIKTLGMLIKILMNRIVGIETMSIYMLIFPTFALFMTISQLGIPTAISKLVAEDIYDNRKMIFSIIPISLLLNFILMVIIITSAPLIAFLLNDNRVLVPIMSISIVLPFDSLSSILRGYFIGKEKMLQHVISLLVEQLVRLLIVVIIIPHLLYKGSIVIVSILIGMNMISECISLMVLILFIKNKRIKKNELFINKDLKIIFNIAIPTTGSKLIGSISYFIEPILITNCLINNGLSKTYIIQEYGIIEGYVLPLLLIPTFITNAISGSIIPDIAKKYVNRNINAIKKRIKKVLKISLFIGFIPTLLLLFYSKDFLMIIYKTTKGSNYVKVLCPFFILYYIESTLEGILQAINKSKILMKNNIIGISIKLFTIYILSFLNIGLYNLIVAIILSIVITTILHIIEIKKTISKFI